MYLIDLNVLFDLAHQRVRHDYAVNLFRSFYAGECRLAISDEIRNELQRTSRSGEQDPMLSLIDALPEVRLVGGKDNIILCDQLAPIVFPEKKEKSQLSENDKSDLMHLATVIHGKLAGLITSDRRILEAAPIIQSRFDIQISSPSDFDISSWQGVRNSEIEAGIQSRLDVKPFQEKDYGLVKDLLMRSGLSLPDIIGGWLPTDMKGSSSTRMVVRQGEVVIAYVSWSRVEPASKEIKVRALLDEEYSHGANVIQMLLRKSLEECDISGIVKLSLYLPERQVSIKEIAHKMGFRATETANRMAKVAVNMIVTPESWQYFVNDLQIAAHIKLPKLAPRFENFPQLIEVGCPDGDRRFVRLDELETLLSPILFCLKGRQAIVIPIKPKYASTLLGHTKQLSLAPKVQAEASNDRLYFNSPNSLKHYQRGNIVLFYESGKKGAQAIVAAARVVDSYLMRCDEVDEQSLSRSVLRSDMMREIGRSANKAACLFDNIVVLQKPVALKFLNNIGYKNNSLLTTNKLSHEQLSRILEEGLRRD